MTKIKVTEIIPKLYHLEFPTLYMMNATLIRFQEYYESPKFKGKAFTLEDYMDWYADKNENKMFDYFSEFEGMNFPITVIEEFEHFCNTLSRKENCVWEHFAYTQDNAYIIATAKTSHKFASKHEIAHGMYYLLPVYKREISKIMNSTATYKTVIKTLKKTLGPKGYHRSILTDECHAYLIDGIGAVDIHAFTGKGRMQFKDLSRNLRKIYKKHLKANKINKKQKELTLGGQ